MFALIGVASRATATFRLSNTLGDGMVLQRDSPAVMWGVGTPGIKALKGVLFGDVFLCGGQSNMQYTPHSMAGMNNNSAEIADPDARQRHSLHDWWYADLVPQGRRQLTAANPFLSSRTFPRFLLEILAGGAVPVAKHGHRPAPSRSVELTKRPSSMSLFVSVPMALRLSCLRSPQAQAGSPP